MVLDCFNFIKSVGRYSFNNLEKRQQFPFWTFFKVGKRRGGRAAAQRKGRSSPGSTRLSPHRAQHLPRNSLFSYKIPLTGTFYRGETNAPKWIICPPTFMFCGSKNSVHTMLLRANNVPFRPKTQLEIPGTAPLHWVCQCFCFLIFQMHM